MKTTDKIVLAVMEKLNSRSVVGLKKYGTPLTREDLTEAEWILHWQEENLDAANYAERRLADLREKYGKCKEDFCDAGTSGLSGIKCFACNGTGVNLENMREQQKC